MTTIDDLIPEVEKAARSATRSWTGALDAEDIVNDVWVKIYEAPKTLPALLSYEADQRGKVLRAIARQCAGSEMSDRELFSANVSYSTDDVRRILAKGGAGDTPGTTTHIEWVDVQAALTAISPWYAEVIFAHYVAGDYVEPPGDKGTTLTRARDALAAAMNAGRKAAQANHEGPGSRRAMSNASARSLTKREGGE
ncbi:hypothetical protein ACWEF6_01760 [Amycolatopsis sp. NPDC004772]